MYRSLQSTNPIVGEGSPVPFSWNAHPSYFNQRSVYYAK